MFESNALRVDIDACGCFVLVGQAQYHRPADQCDNPGNDDGMPTVFANRLEEVKK
jgi:hypothetical protein